MSLASAVGRDRPGTGTALTVVVDDARMSSAVRWSNEHELTAAVARTRDGRRVRLALGTELTLCWSDLGGVRSRRYVVVDVLGGGDPQWTLHPLGPAEAGNRRLAPRADVAVPVGVEGSAGLVVGTTLDLSTSGTRIAFPANPPGSPLRPLPEAGQTARIVLVVEDVRLDFLADVVRLTATADGRRELRASFSDLNEATRAALRATVDRALAAPVS